MRGEVPRLIPKGEITNQDKSDERFDRIWEGIDEYEQNCQSQEFFDQWNQIFGPDPVNFFTAENLAKLKDISLGKRMVFLANAVRSLEVTPEMVKKYYDAFPEDLDAVIYLFEQCQGLPGRYLDYQLFSVSGNQIKERVSAQNPQLQYRVEGFYDISERRRLAPQHLLEGFRPNYADNFSEFGEGATGFLKTLQEASELSISGPHFLNTSGIFTPEYQAMPEQQKARFLRKCLAELQYCLVFEETFNSVFTAERVMENNERFVTARGMNVAHSMLFGTRQPVSIYSTHQPYFERQMNSTAEIGGDVEEYPYHRLLLAVLDELRNITAEKDLNSDTLVDFWNKNRNPIFGNGVADALSSQEVNMGASKLLSLIRTERRNRAPLAAILYRLEFGRLGISEEGVRYLERMYDLGELNNPNYFVNRLTAEGDIGVFNENTELIGYFQLGDLTKDQEKIKAEILSFTYETLFTARKGETPEERMRRERVLQEFQKHYFSFYNGQFFQETRIFFNNLSFQEQGWYLHFVKNCDEKKKQEVIAFSAKFGETGLRTFLSLDYGDELGDVILRISQKFPEGIVRMIFEKYSELVDATKRVEDFATQSMNKRLVKEDNLTIREKLLRKAKDLLIQYANEQIGASHEESSRRIARQLSQIKGEILLFAAVMREMIRYKDFSIQDFIARSIEIKDSSRLTEREKASMLEAFEAGRRRNNYPEELQQQSIDSFKKVLSEPGHEFTLLSHDGNVIAFVRADRLPTGEIYLGSYNLREEAQGTPLAIVLAKNRIQDYGKDHDLVADAYEDNPAVAYYTKILGFKIVERVENHKGRGQTYVKLFRPRAEQAAQPEQIAA